MLARIVSLILVLAVAGISLATLGAAPVKDEMSCCVSEAPVGSCHSRPISADNDKKGLANDLGGVRERVLQLLQHGRVRV